MSRSATIAGVYGAYHLVVLDDETAARPLRAKARGKLRIKYKDKQEKGQAPKTHLLAIGDRVLIELATDANDDIEAHIVELLPRTSLVQRAAYQREQVLAANLDSIVIVTSILQPAFSSGFVDRVLVEALLQKLPATIIVNKFDLYKKLPRRQRPDLSRPKHYASLGYTLFHESLIKRASRKLRKHLKAGRHLLVGQSGVGKSTLLNRLAGQEVQSVGEVGARKGKHTTTNPILYQLKSGASIVDAPGVREYGLQHHEPGAIAGGFVEFADCDCRFDNCMHRDEPACGVRERVESQAIAQFRWASYQAIVDSMGEKYKMRKGNYRR